MHELSLFAQVPSHRHEQILKILAGIAAMPPHSIHERHMIFKPTKEPSRKVAQVGGSQDIQDSQKAARRAQDKGGELYHIQIVEASERDGTKWEMRYYDLPEAGKRSVIARLASITQIEAGDAIAFAEGLGYQFVHQYAIEGQQLVHNNIVLLLHRYYQLPSQNLKDTALHDSSNSRAVLLDSSEAYILKVYLHIADGSDPELMNRGITELLRFKETLKDCLELKTVERLAMDTRVK